MTPAPARVEARRVLVRHLAEQTLRPRPFGDLLAAILDDLTAVGILPPAAAPRPVPPRRVPSSTSRPTVAGWGVEVRAARRARGWTIRDIAARTGVSTGSVLRIEQNKPVRAPLVATILTALDLTPET